MDALREGPDVQHRVGLVEGAELADDPAARTDIPAWCGMKSQQFVAEVSLDRGWSFLIRRAY